MFSLHYYIGFTDAQGIGESARCCHTGIDQKKAVYPITVTHSYSFSQQREGEL